MKIIKESVNIDSIKVGDMITYDSNYIGVTPKIHKGEVIRIEKGYGSKGDPRPPKIFVVKSDSGKLVKVDEAAVEEILKDEDINEDNERSYNPLSDINHLIGKEYSNIHRLGRDLEDLDYDLIYYNDDYIHITDAMESDGIRYIYQIRHNKNGSVSIEKFVKEDEL